MAPNPSTRFRQDRYHLFCQLPSYLAVWYAKQYRHLANRLGLQNLQQLPSMGRSRSHRPSRCALYRVHHYYIPKYANVENLPVLYR